MIVILADMVGLITIGDIAKFEMKFASSAKQRIISDSTVTHTPQSLPKAAKIRNPSHS